jgi:hypothetical protein
VRSLVVIIVVSATALLGSSCSTGRGPSDTVEELVGAARAGDLDAFLRCCDLRTLYKQVVPESEREGLPYDGFVEMTRHNLAGRLKPNAALEYEIEHVDQHGPEATVEIKLRASPDAEWANWKLALVRIGGTWKVTGQGIEPFAPGSGAS